MDSWETNISTEDLKTLRGWARLIEDELASFGRDKASRDIRNKLDRELINRKSEG
jgi:hypothetical protein